MDKIPVVDDFGNKIGDFVPNGNGCGSGIFGAISLLLFSWVYMFKDIKNRPKVWNDTLNEAFKKYWVIGALLLIDFLVFSASSVIAWMISFFHWTGEVFNIIYVITLLGAYFTGMAGSILFLVFLIFFFNDIRNKA